MTIQGIISGRAGVAVVFDGAALTAMYADRPGLLARCAPADLGRLFGGERDLLFVNDTNTREVQRLLDRQVRVERALRLCLIAIDSEDAPDVRLGAAHLVDDLLASPDVAVGLKQIMFSAPLCGSAELPSILESFRRNAGPLRVWNFLTELFERQRFIEIVSRAWELIPSSIFTDACSRSEVQTIAVRAGAFVTLVEAGTLALSRAEKLGRELGRERPAHAATIERIFRTWGELIQGRTDRPPQIVEDRAEIKPAIEITGFGQNIGHSSWKEESKPNRGRAKSGGASFGHGVSVSGVSVAGEVVFERQHSDRWGDSSHASQDEMSFAEMFELAEKQAKQRRKGTPELDGGNELHPGQVLNARIVGFSHDSVFLDVGGKAEGVLAKAELTNEAGELTVKEGEKIEVRVRRIDGGTVLLSRVLAHQSMKNREAVRESQRTGIPIEGKVTAQNRGGFDVDVSGLRAFCPASQIDVRQGDPNQYIGQKFPFKVMEYKDGGRNIVVSRRALLQEERKKKNEELIATLSVGRQVRGTVTSVKDYGAFVDIGGLEGLVHVSEISHGHLNKASDALKIGQEVDAVILKLEPGKEGTKKISLSLKALFMDPWEQAKATIKEGAKVKGKVLRIQPFGAFVEILPGVDGLIHVSNMSDTRVSNPRDVVKENDEVEATVVSVDWDKRRIGLSLVKTPQELANDLASGSVFEGTIDRVESFGLFVKLPTGARGLVPSAETGAQRGADLKKEFKLGTKVKVTVLEVDPNSGKIRLSIKQAVEAEERAEFAGYMGHGAVDGKAFGHRTAGLGTLGDLFKGKLHNSKER